jgi:hypothetical protein
MSAVLTKVTCAEVACGKLVMNAHASFSGYVRWTKVILSVNIIRNREMFVDQKSMNICL